MVVEQSYWGGCEGGVIQGWPGVDGDVVLGVGERRVKRGGIVDGIEGSDGNEVAGGEGSGEHFEGERYGGEGDSIAFDECAVVFDAFDGGEPAFVGESETDGCGGSPESFRSTEGRVGKRQGRAGQGELATGWDLVGEECQPVGEGLKENLAIKIGGRGLREDDFGAFSGHDDASSGREFAGGVQRSGIDTGGREDVESQLHAGERGVDGGARRDRATDQFEIED